MSGSLSTWLARLVLFALIGVCTGPVRADDEKTLTGIHPIVFVHGSAGSGAQFESQALRFTANGYPQSWIRALEYDSLSIATILPQVLADIDALIAQLQRETGQTQVDLVGHSLGTFVSQRYLATPERAARVAHYVNVDGRVADALPGGVPTLALFAGAARRVQGRIVGATNVTLPDQEHIEAVTSAESFVEMFRFLAGREPRTSRIVPSRRRFFDVSGRAVIFPQNTGVDGALLAVFEVDGRTGRRERRFFEREPRPEAVFRIDATGCFGPFRARRGAHYEFVLLREGVFTHHFFFEPFRRSDALVRLNTSNPGQGIGASIERSPNHVALSISRNKEFRGDRAEGENDVLLIEGQNVISPLSAPSGFVGAPAAIFAFDANSDRTTDLTKTPPAFGQMAFLSAVDLFLPSRPPETLSIVTVPRGQILDARRIAVRNLRSDKARVTVQLNDFE
jgi:pimeloyl-ACP methyl ester carboxylesterase